MPTKIRRLKEEAKKAAEARGHKLGNFFHPINSFGFMNSHCHWARAYCKYCGKRVDVDPKPLPNGIEICGDAIALNCTERKSNG